MSEPTDPLEFAYHCDEFPTTWPELADILARFAKVKREEAGVTLRDVINASVSRGDRWLAGTEWTAADYAAAVAGEAGELAGAVIDLLEIEIKTLIIQYRVGEMSNAVKKLRRIENEMRNLNEPGRQLATREEAIRKVGQEMADTILYLPQLAKKLGIDLEARVRETFNAKSEEYGFPERL